MMKSKKTNIRPIIVLEDRGVKEMSYVKMVRDRKEHKKNVRKFRANIRKAKRTGKLVK